MSFKEKTEEWKIDAKILAAVTIPGSFFVMHREMQRNESAYSEHLQEPERTKRRRSDLYVTITAEVIRLGVFTGAYYCIDYITDKIF